MVLEQHFSSILPAAQHGDAAAAHADTDTLRLLLPVKRLGDVDASMDYVRTLAVRAPLRVYVLHVTSGDDDAVLTDERAARGLLAYAAQRYDEQRIVHSSLIVRGEPVFCILDTAEQLDCHQIVMPVRHERRWRDLFSSETTRKVGRLRRDVPLILIDSNGAAREGSQQ